MSDTGTNQQTKLEKAKAKAHKILQDEGVIDALNFLHSRIFYISKPNAVRKVPNN